tara:strand:+ start:4960 stop:5067 length:108 start_codon:yes stop_codon:yes gene_type:complete
MVIHPAFKLIFYSDTRVSFVTLIDREKAAQDFINF